MGALCLTFLTPPAVAVENTHRAEATVGQPVALEGRTLDGKPFSLNQLRGRLVLLVMWHTGCSVCLDKMPELRANVAGWKREAFSLVSVQLDSDLQSPTLYWDAVRRLQPSAHHLPVLWRSDVTYRDNLPIPDAAQFNSLPWSYLVDPTGKLVASYQGRIPPQAWDLVAEHLP